MRILLATTIVLLAACAPDLPAGWEGAEPVAITQKECGGSGLDPNAPKESIVITRAGTDLSFGFRAAHFRCEQKVEGFFRRTAQRLDVLVQPEDMNPGTVAACDCLYDIDGRLPVGDARRFGGYRRWDNINNPNNPVEIGVLDVPSL